ncbi:GIY-YIG nuclease family protein [Candidatus Gracilibacteria bacterium]|nr:GIY-YIG nuclease family protein [Candidatus Gracilibacteria bacterium]
MYFVYLIENFEGRIYIGFTSNLSLRLKRHNNIDSRERRWTKNKGRWRLIYSEEFVTKNEAMKREKYLKSLKAGQKIKKILDITSHSGVAQR